MPVCCRCGGEWMFCQPGEAEVVVDYHLRRPRQYAGRNIPAQFYCFDCWWKRMEACDAARAG